MGQRHPHLRDARRVCLQPEIAKPATLCIRACNLRILIYEMPAVVLIHYSPYYHSYPPFYDDDPLGIYQKVLEGKVKFPWHFDRHSKVCDDETRRVYHASTMHIYHAYTMHIYRT